MKRLFLTLITLLVLSSFQQTPNIDKTLSDINNNFENMEVRLINWPKHIQPKLGKLKQTAFMAFPKKKTKGKLPLLISLHGAGGKTWTIEEQLKRSAKVKGLSLVELVDKELILLEPNSFENWDPKTLNAMLDYILEIYPEIDSSRIYLMGHSMGGLGTWDWILETPERFAAAAPCGFSGVDEKDDIRKLTKLPVFGMVGGEDLKNVASVKKMTTLLQAAGNKNVQYITFPKANHSQGNKQVFSNTEWIDWMFTFSSEN